MSLVVRLLAWLMAALVAATAYWYVVVYLLDEFDRGYGQSNWFLLQLYLIAIYTPVGLAGYAAFAIVTRENPGGVPGALAAGAAFTLGVRLVAYGIHLSSADLSLPLPLWGVGLLIGGALSGLAARLAAP